MSSLKLGIETGRDSPTRYSATPSSRVSERTPCLSTKSARVGDTTSQSCFSQSDLAVPAEVGNSPSIRWTVVAQPLQTLQNASKTRTQTPRIAVLGTMPAVRSHRRPSRCAQAAYRNLPLE